MSSVAVRANAARGAATLLALALSACGEPPAPAPEPPPDPAPTTPWHREPVLGRAASRNVVFLNHADAALDAQKIVSLLQTQYEFLRQEVGVAPRWIFVHTGRHYPCGFATPGAEHPEMFLCAAKILDTSNDYAHEMLHCFTFRYGRLPHWFGESIADVAYVDSEIDLYQRQEAAPFLARFDRVDHRSYELLRLRVRYGRGLFPKVYRALEARREECLRTFSPVATLGSQNLLLLSVLSEAAGEDLTPLFTKELGFNPRTRERQRGY